MKNDKNIDSGFGKGIDKKRRIAYYIEKLFALHIITTVQTEQVMLHNRAVGRRQQIKRHLRDSFRLLFRGCLFCEYSENGTQRGQTPLNRRLIL